MSKATYVFCEGGGNSHDGKILGKLFDELTFKPVLIPSGGKRGMAAFVQGYFSGAKVVSSDTKLAFRDRDFDFPVPDMPSLIETEKIWMFAGFRTSIENYLLDSKIFFDFLDQNHIRDTGIENPENAKLLFDEVALELKYYSAARHSLGKIRARMDFDTTWTHGSGDLPKSLAEAYCINKSLQLIEPIRLKSVNLTEEVFQTHFAVFLEKFNDVFFENADYLIWFSGKDIMEAIHRRLGRQKFSPKLYYNFAHKQFDFRKFPDLTELFDKLNNLS
jgi:hypothetical protein